ncbi:Phage Tail Collar Domain protein [compost metagenome]
MSDPFLGEIRMVGFNFAPRGWALCWGQQMGIAQNSALFSLLGTLYGGNGQTTFGLPDYRGRSPVGMGQGPGLSNIDQGELAGSESVTLTINQMPIHNHAIVVSAVTGNAQVAVPANSSSTTTVSAPSATAVLGPVAAAGRAGSLYTNDAPNTTLAPFTASVTCPAPTATCGNAGGSQPFGLRNPFLGTNFVIALEGIFPSRN